MANNRKEMAKEMMSKGLFGLDVLGALAGDNFSDEGIKKLLKETGYLKKLQLSC